LKIGLRPDVIVGMAAAILVSAGVVLFPLWRSTVDRELRRQTAEPFRIAGNLYYVGGSYTTSFLLTGPEGHVLIDGGYAATASQTIASIATLGFDIKDVKMLLNSEPHADHAGGLAALQQASGAALWASEGSAAALASGGDEGSDAGVFRAFVWAGLLSYPAVRVDRRFQDGDTLRVGPIAVTAHVTGGFTRGCTSWSFVVRDRERDLQVVRVCDLSVLPGKSLVEPELYPGIRADFERSFRVLRRLPVDIWLASHAREFGRYRKFLERAKASDPTEPFIDPDGYRRYLDGAERNFRALLAEQERRSAKWGSFLAGFANRFVRD
jgi:metallo-beta-lactamase class B